MFCDYLVNLAPLITFGVWLVNRRMRYVKNLKQHILIDNFSDQKPACSLDERSESEASTPIGRSRTYFTPEQVEMLEKAYDSNPYPDQNEKEQIASKSGLNENKVQASNVFFVNVYNSHSFRSGFLIDVLDSAKI